MKRYQYTCKIVVELEAPDALTAKAQLPQRLALDGHAFDISLQALIQRLPHDVRVTQILERVSPDDQLEV